MTPDIELEPIDPEYRPTKTLSELSAEHPEWLGLRQLAAAEQMVGRQMRTPAPRTWAEWLVVLKTQVLH